jgi:PAS domain S-box-containing protein
MSKDRVNVRTVDYKQAFENAPVGQAIGRNRVIVACNRMFSEIFRSSSAELIGQTFERLYPSQADFQKAGHQVGKLLAKEGVYSDDRIMRRVGGELFWVCVRGYSYTPASPHAHTLWVFTELKKHSETDASLRSTLTPRERDIAALLIESKSAKEIGLILGISPRTVEIYKSRLLRKYGVNNTPTLAKMLLAG